MSQNTMATPDNRPIWMPTAGTPRAGQSGARVSWRQRVAVIAILVVVALAIGADTARASSRIKDIADFEGIRDNLLIGYGLVVGLNGTGDDLGSAIFTRQSLEAMLERLGVNTRGADIDTDNVAAVMVSAKLPPFARHGTEIDITVSALGDASSLLGGTLLVTPMMGADGEVYAVAQGSLVVGGFAVGGAAEDVVKGVPTGARIPGGAIVEREVGFELATLDSVRISLRNPDLTTARRMARAINAFLSENAASALDPGTIHLRIPDNYSDTVVGLLTDIEQVRIEPDQPARVVIDETTGVIVIGSQVRVDQVAIAQGNLTVRITETPQVSQPGPFAQTGDTVIVPRTQVDVDEGGNNKLTIAGGGVSLQELVDGLNALGIGPRDMISILQALRTAGALQADLVVM